MWKINQSSYFKDFYVKSLISKNNQYYVLQQLKKILYNGEIYFNKNMLSFIDVVHVFILCDRRNDDTH